MIYAKVGIMRDAGLEARWGETKSNAPMLFVRNPKAKNKHQRDSWWVSVRHKWKKHALCTKCLFNYDESD